MSNETVTISKLVEMRKIKENELKQSRIKSNALSKDIRDLNKKIQQNLNSVIIEGGNPQVALVDPNGYDYKSRDQMIVEWQNKKTG